jgi:sec-independent protein translocase protein TatA
MFEGLFQPAHLLLVFFIALLVFGPKKIPDLGKSLGEAMREFKSAMAPEDNRSISTTESNENKNQSKQVP